MTIDELFTFIATKARKIYDKDHRHHPMFFVDFKRRTLFEGKEVDFAIVPVLWDSVADRDVISISMKALCGLGLVRNIAFVHEVWMARAKDASIPPSEHPDRTSVLWLNIESCDFERRTGYWPVIDADTRRARLGQFEDLTSAGPAEGRFANMFGTPPGRQ